MTPHRHTEPLAALRRVVLGLLVVVLDLNFGRFDVLLDPVGYLVVALALGGLVPLHRGFAWARNAAGAGVATSTLGLFLRSLDPDTGAVVEGPGIELTDAVLDVIIVVSLCTAMLALCRSPRVLGPARVLRWASPSVTIVGALAGLVALLSGASGEQWAGPTQETVGGPLATAAVVLVLAALGLAVWFFVVLWRASREPVLTTDPGPAMIPE